MDERARRAELGTLYLLGHRDEALRALCPEPRPNVERILEGLCDKDRQVRAQALSRAVRDMVTDLGTRELGAAFEETC